MTKRDHQANDYANETNGIATRTAQAGGNRQTNLDGSIPPSPATRPGEINGMRTERVTLEITYGTEDCREQDGPSDWPWETILAIYPGESVRVVPSVEADAEIERLRARVAELNGVIPVEFDAAGDLVPAVAVVQALKARVAELESQQKRRCFLSEHCEAYAWETAADGWEIGSREHAEWDADLKWIKLTAQEDGNENGGEGDRPGAGCVRCGRSCDGGVLADDAGGGVEVTHQGGEAVAYAALRGDGSVADAGTSFYEMARIARYVGGVVVDLYRSPQPLLTEEEREAVDNLVAVAEWKRRSPFVSKDDAQRLLGDASVARGLLKRAGGGK